MNSFLNKGTTKRIALWLVGILLVGSMNGCATTEVNTELEIERDNIESALSETGVMDLYGNHSIKDNDGWYDNWNSNDVVTMYLTVSEGNPDDGTNHTWEEINTHSAYYYEDLGIDRYKVEGLLQVGDENGPVEGELGYGKYTPNAIVQIRGQTSSRRKQKNYRISLKDDKGDWEGMTTINLNKHVSDGFRFTNLLAYNLMQEVEDMISARTRFVHLYVKDDTASGEEDGFVDYGLYTFVEQINKSFLTNHGLDKNGQLYKVNYFEFYEYEDIIMLKNTIGYDAKKFEERLEIKGDDDHSKLMAMLQDLNDYSIPIEEVFNKWFDTDNYFTYLAFHILIGNKDTQSRNQFLYSPSNLNKFYFISWDNDGALSSYYAELHENQQGLGFEEGISNYWGNVLHRRILENPKYRQMLDDKIHELKETVLSKENVMKKAESYARTVLPYLYELPDIEYAPFTYEEYDYGIENLYSQIEDNYNRYLLSLEKPMPFFLGVPQMEDGKITFIWDTSYDFDQENITYTFEVSDGYTFSNVLYSEKDLIVPGASVKSLPPGQYFFRVKAKNTSGYEQVAFDYYNSERGKEYGVRCFYVTESGKVQVEVYEE